LTVLVVDDHQLVLDAIRTALAEETGIEVLAEVRSGQEAIDALSHTHADVVLLDLHMPGMDGLACLAEIKTRSRDTKVIVLSGTDEPHDIRRALDAGADAFLSKLVDPRDLAAMIRQTAGGTFLAPLGARAADNGGIELTTREREVLRGLADGAANKQIALSLGLSEQAVKYHASRLYTKLGVRGRIDAVRAAYDAGLL